MAIDMIENNELGALAPSRLGLRQFADEDFQNYTGGDEFFNLFGSRKRKKAKYSNAAQDKLADLPKDCARIQQSIDIISNEAQRLLKQRSTLATKTMLVETNNILAEFKQAQIEQNCTQQFEQTQKETERAGTLDILTRLSDDSVSKAQAELQGLQLTPTGEIDKAAQNKKLLIYAGVGIGAIVLIALILKK